MSDIGGGSEFMPGLSIGFGAMLFALGFFPGFVYISDLLFTPKKRPSSFSFLYSYVAGIILSIISYFALISYLSTLPPAAVINVNSEIFYAIILEILLIILHFIFIKKHLRFSVLKKRRQVSQGKILSKTAGRKIETTEKH